MKSIVIAAIAASLAACASPYSAPRPQILVDTKGVDMSKYYQDEAECKALAARVEGQNASAAFWSSLSVGPAQANASLKALRDTAMRSCLKGRGYVALF